MKRTELIELLRSNRFAVEASLHADGRPQAAVVGVAVTDELELVFDTVTSSRKYENLQRDGRCAFAWWHDSLTVQLEGIADEPVGDELDRVKSVYFEAFPDGRERARWPTIAYFRVRVTWARISDFSTQPPRIAELAL